MKKKFVLLLAIGMLYCCEAIFVENISNTSVSILAPTHGATIPEGLVNFNWNAVADATSYQIQIATPTFSNATQIVLDTTITKTSFSKNLPVALYQWKVIGMNSDYETTATIQSFEIE